MTLDAEQRLYRSFSVADRIDVGRVLTRTRFEPALRIGTVQCADEVQGLPSGV